jgi:DNA-binding transcriptional MerR regulator
LSEIKELLELNTKPRATCEKVKIKTTQKIKEIEAKIADLSRMKASLEKLACACDASQDIISKIIMCSDPGTALCEH